MKSGIPDDNPQEIPKPTSQIDPVEEFLEILKKEREQNVSGIINKKPIWQMRAEERSFFWAEYPAEWVFDYTILDWKNIEYRQDKLWFLFYPKTQSTLAIGTEVEKQDIFIDDSGRAFRKSECFFEHELSQMERDIKSGENIEFVLHPYLDKIVYVLIHKDHGDFCWKIRWVYFNPDEAEKSAPKEWWYEGFHYHDPKVKIIWYQLSELLLDSRLTVLFLWMILWLDRRKEFLVTTDTTWNPEDNKVLSRNEIIAIIILCSLVIWASIWKSREAKMYIDSVQRTTSNIHRIIEGAKLWREQ